LIQFIHYIKEIAHVGKASHRNRTGSGTGCRFFAERCGSGAGRLSGGLRQDHRGARKEGKVVVYSTTDSKAADALIKDFSALYPAVKVEYNDMNSTEVYNRFISEAAAGGTTADVMWSSSMDLQVKLVAEGYGMPYKSPEAAAVPGWANLKDTAYGTTFEPAAIVYNKRLVPADEVPATHAEFTKLLITKHDKYKNKVTTYDIEKSGVGFSLITHDLKLDPHFWDLPRPSAASRCAYSRRPAPCWSAFPRVKT